MDVGISGYRGADIDADWGCVDQLDVMYAICLYRRNALRQLFLRCQCGQPRNQALQYHCGLARTRDAGYCCKLPFRYLHVQRLYGMDWQSLHMDTAVFKKTACTLCLC